MDCKKRGRIQTIAFQRGRRHPLTHTKRARVREKFKPNQNQIKAFASHIEAAGCCHSHRSFLIPATAAACNSDDGPEQAARRRVAPATTVQGGANDGLELREPDARLAVGDLAGLGGKQPVQQRQKRKRVATGRDVRSHA